LGGSIRVVDGSGAPHSLNGNMLPWGGTYNDEQLGAVLSYVRQAWGNNAPIIKPEEIAAIRKAVATHPAPFKPDELMQMPLQPLMK
jgi:mono/diheme cytochrome c family protein